MLRPLVTVSVIVASELPYSQTLSVRLGAPSAGLPLPSAPWHAAQSWPNFSLPCCARSGSAFRPESERTYATTFFTPSSPSAAACGGITPMRPPVIVSTMVLASPP